VYLAKALTGMRGVYLVAAELSRLGFIASPTSRNVTGADILVTDQSCARTYSVQVKTNAKTFGFWLVGAKAKTTSSATHIYVFVNLRSSKTGEATDFYVVPSKTVAERTVVSSAKTGKKSTWYQFNLSDAKEYKNGWSVFGLAEDEPT
jgi:hypothetical protein